MKTTNEARFCTWPNGNWHAEDIMIHDPTIFEDESELATTIIDVRELMRNYARTDPNTPLNFDESAGDPGYWGWLQTFTGKKFFPLQPWLYEIEILDLAHGCALENRYGGQTREPYSVAQHQCVVSAIVERVFKRPDIALEAHCHDLAEGLLKDLPRDIKLALPDYKKKLEHPFEECIAKRFDLVFPWNPLIKHADNIALMTERRDLFNVINPDWIQRVEPLPQRIVPMDWRDAEKTWLDTFYRLLDARKAAR